MWKTATPTATPMPATCRAVDPETGNGIITDVCLKRKIRNYVQDAKEDESGWRIYIKDQVPLNRSDLEAGEALGIGEELAEIQKGKDAKKIVTKLRSNDPDIDPSSVTLCAASFFDIRTFGAVMTTFSVRGAFKLRSGARPGAARLCPLHRPHRAAGGHHHPHCHHHRIRCPEQTTEIGCKYVVPYGLLPRRGLRFRQPRLPRDRLLRRRPSNALAGHSICLKTTTAPPAANGRGELIIFKHASELGNAASYKLSDAVTVKGLTA